MKAIIYVGAKITALNDKTKKQSMYFIDIQQYVFNKHTLNIIYLVNN